MLEFYMVITGHQWYQSLYYPTNAQRKICGVIKTY